MTNPNRFTDKQVAYIRDLIANRQCDAAAEARIEAAREAARRGRLTRRGASDLIEFLLALPLIPEAPVTPAPEPERVPAGGYRLDGVVYRVRESRKTGYMFAEALVEREGGGWGFEYAQGVYARLRGEHALTKEQAAQFGTLTGTCALCGRLLTDPHSVETGIGPICAKRYA